jgi:hypothetical protein
MKNAPYFPYRFFLKIFPPFRAKKQGAPPRPGLPGKQDKKQRFL